MILPVLSSVPHTLRSRPQWVLWRAEGPEQQKIPRQANMRPAKSTDPTTWAPFRTVAEAYLARPQSYSGVGYVFSGDDGLVGCDLDDCRDPETGALTDDARALLDTLNSYSEVSPSGTGVKVWLKGTLTRAVKTPTIELYSAGRYFTVTGARLQEYPDEPQEAQAAIDALVARLTPPEPERRPSTPTNGTHPQPGDRLNRYAEAALQGEVQAVALAGEGTRNDTLNTAAFNLGQMVGAGLLDEHTVFDALDGAAARAGLPLGESTRTIRSGLRAGMQDPRRVPPPSPSFARNGSSGGHSAPPAADEPELPPGRFHRTDLGNARRLVAHHGEDLRYVPAWACWLVWDGQHWQRDEDGAVARRARQVIGTMYQEAAEAEDPDERRAIVKWAMSSEGRRRLEAMVALAEAEPGIAIKHEQLNASPHLITVANGTLDLRTGELGPHQREHLSTKTLAVAYDPTATCPTWETFLRRVLADDDELIGFVQRAVGYTLTAETREECLFFLYGTGRNGKSTFIETLFELFGVYGQKAPTEMLMARPQGGGIPNDVAQLPGRRFVVTAETEEGRRLNESLVKDLTSHDRLTARFMRGEFFEFKPTHKLWMYGNHKPVIRGADTGIWRRMRAIPFTVTIPPEEVDRTLPAKLRAELPGILVWAVRGCLDWQQQGLGAAKAVDELTEFYRAEMDILGAFLDEHCIIAPAAKADASALYRAYKAWAESNGESAVAQRRFGTQLSERGFGRHKDGAGRIVRLGIGLRARDGHAPPGDTDKRTNPDEIPLSPHVDTPYGGYMDLYPASSVRPSKEIQEGETEESEGADPVASSYAAGMAARLKERRDAT